MFVKELQYAARSLNRAPRFTLACVFTLAFALAGTATLVNLLEAFVFRQLAVSEPDRLLGIFPATGEYSAGFSAPALQALTARQQVVTDICGVTAGYGTLSVKFDSGAARQRPVEAVTGNCYDLLGLTAAVGRLIAPADAPLSGEPAPVVVISDRIWREELGASPDVVGRIVRLEGTPLTIVGVLPASYRGMNADEAPDIALPITLPWKLKLLPPLAMHAVGRLRPGIGFAEAAAQLTSIWPQVLKDSQAANTPTPRAVANLRTLPLDGGFSMLRERYRRPLFALVALAGCLLVLACVNIGGLSLARLLDRRDTFAVQLALGAGRGRLAVQLLYEAMLIGGAAILPAIPLAWWSAQLAAHTLWTGARPSTFQMTAPITTLVITAGIGLLASLFVAVPGWVALSIQNWDLGARSVGHGARSGRRRGVVAAQIALCFVLAFVASLFSVNLYALRQLPLGYEPMRLQWVQLNMVSRTAVVTPTIGYVDTLLSEIESLPDVEFAAISQGSFGRTGSSPDTLPVGRGNEAGSVEALMDRVSPGFFRTTSIALHQGRDFTWSDVSNGTNVTILNRSLADRLFPKGDALGSTIKLGRTQVATIIGIAGNAVPGDPRAQDVPQYYRPLAATAPPVPALLLRLRTSALARESLRELIEPLGRHEVVRVSSMSDEIDRFLVQERLISSASVLFAALATVVSIAGLYAAMSQNISRRQREIGIRIAVGATPNMVRRLVFTEVGWILALGLGVRLPAALAGGHAARSLLTGTSANTSSLLAMTGLAIAAGAALVSAWPAQRAACTSVASALRAE